MILLTKTVANLSESALRRFVTRARNAANLKGQVNVLVTSSVEMRRLNRQFRGKNKATDVLSFPAESNGARPAFAGEIALSAEIAAHNARALGHSTSKEIKVLVLHGILHLRGYDHEQDQGQMARREKQLRELLHLPSGLIERETLERGTIDETIEQKVTGRTIAKRGGPKPAKPPSSRRNTRSSELRA